MISIHAAREGGDLTDGSDEYARIMISIHAAREGGDCYRNAVCLFSNKFQSTPPVKAAT